MALDTVTEKSCDLGSSKGFDWTNFLLTIYIRSTPEKIFQSWTTERGLTAFFTRQTKIIGANGTPRAFDEPAQPGDKYEWMVVPQAGIEYGSFIEAKSNEFVKFHFSGDETPVSIFIHQISLNDCRVQLKMENLPDTDKGHSGWHLSCRLGWSKYLTNLKTVLESGVDIRELSPGRDREDIVN